MGQVKESVDYYARKASVELFNKSNRYRKRGVCMVPTKYGIGVSSAENRLQVLHHICNSQGELFTLTKLFCGNCGLTNQAVGILRRCAS